MNPVNHVAIIMDGNGRWGLKQKKTRNAGLKAGLKSVERIIKKSIEYNIKDLMPEYYLNSPLIRQRHREHITLY